MSNEKQEFLDVDASLLSEADVKEPSKAVSFLPKNTPFQEETDLEYNSDRTIIVKAKVKKYPSHYVIPEGVVAIAKGAFMGNRSLYSITLPHSLKRIEENAFCSSGLQTVRGGDQIEYIGAWAFSWCFNLRGFNIPKTVKEIDSNPFALSVTRRTLAITSESSRFVVLNDLLIDCQKGIAISYNGMESTVVLPDIIRCIGDSCFRGADRVKKLVIPKSVTMCENNPIPMCGIEVIESFSDNLIVRDHFLISGNTVHAFFGNEESVVIPEGITVLAECSFDCIMKLKSVQLPSSIQDVGEDPFGDCENLKTIIVPDGEVARVRSIFPEDYKVEFVERHSEDNLLTIVKRSFLSDILGRVIYNEIKCHANKIITIGTCVLVVLLLFSLFVHWSVISALLSLVTGTSLLFIVYILALIVMLDVEVDEYKYKYELGLENSNRRNSGKEPKSIAYKRTVTRGFVLIVVGLCAIVFSNRYRNHYAFECETFLVDHHAGIYHLNWDNECDVAAEAIDLEEMQGYQIDQSYTLCGWCDEWAEEVEGRFRINRYYKR